MMNEDMHWMKMKWMHKMLMLDLLLSISFSVFGMLLIFGLGFVFPTINPYVVIKWIIIVAGVVFLVSFLKFVFHLGMSMKMMKMWRNEWKEMGESKTKKTSKK